MAGKKGLGLGKGLDALFFDNATGTEEGNSGGELMRISEIEPNRSQPRKDFDDESLQQLADSIREHGLIQPLIVRPLPEGNFQIVAGERRWRACRMAGLNEVPVYIREFDDQKTMEIALIENLQREDLNILEEALGFQELMQKYGMTQAEVAKSVGKSRPVIANALRLLNLPEEIRELLREGKLSAGQARAILSFETEEQMIDAARKTVEQGWNVRDLEKLAKKLAEGETGQKAGVPKIRDSYYSEMELAVKAEIGRAIKVKEKGDKGMLEIPFHSKEDLADIIQRISGKF